MNASPTPTTPLVFLLEDIPHVLEAQTDLLEDADFRVLSATSLAEAHALLSAPGCAPPDVALLDMRLNQASAYDATGLSLIPFLKERFPRCRVFMLSGFGSDEHRAKAKALGAEDFLSKHDMLSDSTEFINAFKKNLLS